MKLHLLRHGRADWDDWQGSDDDRPLTKKGKKEMRRVAEFLRRLKVEPALILTSPLPRAAETAGIVARELGVELKQEPLLVPGFRSDKCRRLLKNIGDQDLMIVGHEPDFSLTIAHLTGAKIKLAKGGVARVDLEKPAGDGRLIWLIAPEMAEV
jgi:phosphohistidine phosphatase